MSRNWDPVGRVNLCGVLVLLIVISGAYLGYKVGSPWYAYYSLKDTIEGQAKVGSAMKERSIRRTLATEARDLGIPLGEKDFVFIRSRGKVSIRVQWSVTVEFPFGYSKRFQFEVDTGKQ